MTENELSFKIIGVAIEVHRHLGPELLESAYEQCLCHELKQNDLRIEQQIWLPVCDSPLSLNIGFTFQHCNLFFNALF